MIAESTKRIIQVVAERLSAGESRESIGEDYGLETWIVDGFAWAWGEIERLNAWEEAMAESLGQDPF